MADLASDSAQSTWVVETESLWRIYRVGRQEVRALCGVDLQIAGGRLVVVRGRSGSGKTTLLNCLGGLDRPTSGMVRVLGEAPARMDDRRLTQWRREQVGLVFQSFALLPLLSAYENVELPLRLRGVPYTERRARALECLEMVGLGSRLHHRPYELSGGQQQRVAVARALANRPRLILADEPTAELDSVTAREIMGIFRRVVDTEGVTLLVASHDVLLDEYADEVLFLRDGRIFRSL